jgi:hypothetical protein
LIDNHEIITVDLFFGKNLCDLSFSKKSKTKKINCTQHTSKSRQSILQNPYSTVDLLHPTPVLQRWSAANVASEQHLTRYLTPLREKPLVFCK